jgi:hypothetical protein
MMFYSLAILRLFLVRRSSMSVIMTYCIPGLPHLVGKPFRSLRVALTYPTQYDSNGMVKPIRHPERLRILRRRGSRADIVSTIFSGASLSL